MGASRSLPEHTAAHHNGDLPEERAEEPCRSGASEPE